MALRPRLLLFGFIFLTGCAWPRITTQSKPFYPGQGIIVNAASQTDWLVIIGAVTIAFGVAAFLNGNAKSTAIIAAGVTIVAISLLVTTYLSMLAQYHTEFIIALAVLSAIAFFTFAHTAADFNKDGKIDWQDLHFLFDKLFFRKTPRNVIEKTASPPGL